MFSWEHISDEERHERQLDRLDIELHDLKRERDDLLLEVKMLRGEVGCWRDGVDRAMRLAEQERAAMTLGVLRDVYDVSNR